ncbi:MAG: hypothetical protein H5U11_17180 [Rhizobium sp.]|nr:hypothetical protein [Rhizobium sp.]
MAEMAGDRMAGEASLVADRDHIQRPEIGEQTVDRGVMAQQVTLAPDDGRDHPADRRGERLGQGDEALGIAFGLLAAIAQRGIGGQRGLSGLRHRRAGRNEEHQPDHEGTGRPATERNSVKRHGPACGKRRAW